MPPTPRALLFALATWVAGCGGGQRSVVDTSLGMDRRIERASKTDPAATTDAFRTACARGDSGSCVNLGVIYRRGLGVERDDGAAFRLNERACSLGNARGCSNLGFMHSEGLGTPRDPQAASALFTQSCDLGDTEGCRNLAEMLRTGAAGRQDHAQTFGLLVRACDGGNAAACNDLGWCHQDGIGTPRDIEQAGRRYHEACEAGLGRGCTNLGTLHMAGPGLRLAKDPRLARELIVQGCYWGDGAGCERAAAMYRAGYAGTADEAKAVEYQRQACAKGVTEACVGMPDGPKR